MRVWRYINKSKPEIPSRDITWKLDLRAASVEYVGGWRFHSLTMRAFGLLHCTLNNPHGLPNHCWLHVIRWGICGSVCLGVHTSLMLGVTKHQLLDRRLRRLIRKTSPEQIKRLREVLLDAD